MVLSPSISVAEAITQETETSKVLESINEESLSTQISIPEDKEISNNKLDFSDSFEEISSETDSIHKEEYAVDEPNNKNLKILTKTDGTNRNSTHLGTLGTCSWEITDDGVLTIFEGELPSLSESPWIEYKNEINKVVINGSITTKAYMNNLFDGLSNVTEISGLNNIDTSNTTRMMYLFRGCSSLKEVDLSSWSTSKVTTFTSMFNGCSSITELDLSNFDTSVTNSYISMFAGCESLETLDISGLGKKKTTNAYKMFDSSNKKLRSITVGEYTPFDASDSGLPSHTATGSYTEGWIGVNTSQYYTSSKNFANKYDGSSPDTYVWATRILVEYLDEHGNKLHKDNEIIGYLGGGYDATIDDYQLEIPGYQLNTSKLPDNVTGIFTEELQTIKLVYSLPDAKDITIKYINQEGSEIHPSKTISGSLEDAYDATTDDYKISIDGYILDESKLPDNAVGIMSDKEQEVVYVYTPIKDVELQTVIVRFVDEAGKALASPKTLHGAVGEN
ncbi:MucBP domain-containing protein, partial [Vagococcus xieshaowenii]